MTQQKYKKNEVCVSLDKDSTCQVLAQAAKHSLVAMGGTLALLSPAHAVLAEGLKNIKEAVRNLTEGGLDLKQINKVLSKPKKLGGRA